MLRQWVFFALVAPCIGVIQSWPAWKAAYNTAAAGKSSFEVKLLNKDIEGSIAPTVTANQPLWTWFSEVHAGTEKTAAQSLMSTTFAGLGGDGSIQNEFASKSAIALNGAATTKDAYDYYHKILSVPQVTTPTNVIPLHRQYHSMSAEQQKTAKSSLLSALGAKWDTAFAATGFTSWTGAADYKAKTGIIYSIMDTTGTRPANAAAGQDFYDTYKAASGNSDKDTMSFFDRKMAAKLRAGLD